MKLKTKILLLWRYIIEYIRYDIPAGIMNIKRWYYVIWCDRDFNWTFIMIILRHKLKLIKNGYDKHHKYVGQEKEIHNLKVAILLIDRILEDEYIFNKQYYKLLHSEPRGSKLSYNFYQRIKEQDMEMLFSILQKHLKTWWF